MSQIWVIFSTEEAASKCLGVKVITDWIKFNS